MNPYDPDVQIKELLMMARIWIRRRADEHAEKQEALTRAWAKAESEGVATPDLSKSGFDMLCKKFKTQHPKCAEHAWYKKFKSLFEEIREARRATERQAEEDRVEQARIRNEARKAKLTNMIKESKEEESETFKEIFAPPTRHPGQASSSGDHHGASPAEPAGSGEASQANRGEPIPRTPPRTTQNMCQVCEVSVHEHSVCAFCEQWFCGRHRYNTKCCRTWKCSVLGGDCTCYCKHPGPAPPTAVWASKAAPKAEPDDEQMEDNPLFSELTPSPLPNQEQGTEETQSSPRPNPPLRFTSVEDLKETLTHEGGPSRGGRRLTDAEYSSVIAKLAPGIDKYRLKQGWDGETRWPTTMIRTSRPYT